MPYLRRKLSQIIRLRSYPLRLPYRYHALPQSSRSPFFSPPKLFLLPRGHSYSYSSINSQRHQHRLFSTTRICASSPGVPSHDLPLCCPGCGAYSQTVDPNDLGYFGEKTRRRLGAEKLEKLKLGIAKLKELAEKDAREVEGLQAGGEVATEIPEERKEDVQGIEGTDLKPEKDVAMAVGAEEPKLQEVPGDGWQDTQGAEGQAEGEVVVEAKPEVSKEGQDDAQGVESRDLKNGEEAVAEAPEAGKHNAQEVEGSDLDTEDKVTLEITPQEVPEDGKDDAQRDEGSDLETGGDASAETMEKPKAGDGKKNTRKFEGPYSATEGEAAAETIEQFLQGNIPKPRYRTLMNIAAKASRYAQESSSRTPVCDRCHDLIHHNKAISAPSPSIHSIRDFLEESPYKHNRVYHVVDAADFPMSVIPNIYSALSLQEQRSRNRRASDEKYRKGRKLPTISFIITRSDLLAATKEQVDSKMEYMRSVLRQTLSRANADARLGNVLMISAHRGWWTTTVKEDIKKHGQGIWVVGKANVGKSNFIEACFPKDSRNLGKIAELVEQRRMEGLNPGNHAASMEPESDSLLPPAPREDMYPVLPVVSSLSGTTVSPIRIPFGRGKGEMIDLPGLERGHLEDHVRDEHKRDLIMTKRPKPERISIKSGQSLLLGGGLIRITPTNAADVLMAACFLPLESHITKTDKAIEMQAEKRAYPGRQNIATPGFSETIQSAGIFNLEHDVTKSHLPTAIAKAMEDRKARIPRLPYKVMSTDILIEGCGWIELTVQVRAKALDDESPRSLPQVEVFSPNGQHIGARKPIECWHFIAQKKASDKRKRGSRGRQNIGQKRRIRSSS